MKMKSFLVFVLVLMPCHFCKAQQHSSSHEILLPAPNVEKEEMAERQTSRTETESERGEGELQLDIWAELRALRDMVMEQKVELSHLTARVAAAESLVETLQNESRGTPH